MKKLKSQIFKSYMHSNEACHSNLSGFHALPAQYRVEHVARIEEMISAEVEVRRRTPEALENFRRIVEEPAVNVQDVVVEHRQAVLSFDKKNIFGNSMNYVCILWLGYRTRKNFFYWRG